MEEVQEHERDDAVADKQTDEPTEPAVQDDKALQPRVTQLLTWRLLLLQLNQDVKVIMQQRAGIRADQLSVWIDETGLQQDAAEKVVGLAA